LTTRPAARALSLSKRLNDKAPEITIDGSSLLAGSNSLVMPQGISLQEATVLRNTSLNALNKALASKAVNAEGVSTQRNSIVELREQFIFWDEYVEHLKGRGPSMTYRNLIGGEV
jgi:hypothetical protein